MYDPVKSVDWRRLPPPLVGLVEEVAERVHDAWARERFDRGWRQGPRTDSEARTHTGLVPYAELEDSEREYDRQTAAVVIEALLEQGRLTCVTGRTGEKGDEICEDRARPCVSAGLGRATAAEWTRRHAGKVLGFAAFVAFCCGAIGFQLSRPEPTLLQAVYSTLQLFVLEGSFERSPDCALLELARFLAPASTFGSVVTAFLLAFELQAKRRNVGRLRDHVVLCGLGPWGVALARELRAAGKAVVVLTLDRSASHVAEVEALGAAVFEGDSSSARSLRLVGADKAAYVLAITDDSAVNYRVAEQLRTMDGHPTVYVHTPDVSSMELLLGESEHAFNAYELAARQLLEDVALDGHAGIRSDEPHGHVVLAFMGFGVMSEAILVHAARTMHLANGERLRARVYSCDADVLKRLVSNHPHINAVCSVSHVAVSPKDSALFSDLEQLEQAPGARVSIIVELDDDVQSLAAAVRCERSTNDAQVLVRVDELGGSGVVATDARRLRVFGRPDTYCTWEAILDGEDGVLLQRAKASHQAYLDSLDDTGEERPAQRPWERLHREYRTANIRRAIAAPIQWRALGRGPEGSPAELTASECRTVAQMEHARWLHDKMLDGWTWGEARDPARRKSPALVAWDKLPEPERKRQTNEAATLVDIMKIGGAEPGGSGG